MANKIEETSNFVQGIIEGKNALHSSEPISKVFGKAIGKTFGNVTGAASALVDNGVEGLQDFYKVDGKYNKSRIALTAFGAFAVPNTAFRFASGGGLYRDNDGDFNIVGIPFI